MCIRDSRNVPVTLGIRTGNPLPLSWVEPQLACPTSRSNPMFKTAEEALAYVKEEGVEYVDIRFCDLPGVMQHFNIPAHQFTEDVFADGAMFDGSSIRGFQTINESDMKLLPDVATSGSSFMSDSLMVWNPRIDDPSNMAPSAKTSSVNWWAGMLKCCITPGRSQKRMSTYSTPSSFT